MHAGSYCVILGIWINLVSHQPALCAWGLKTSGLLVDWLVDTLNSHQLDNHCCYLYQEKMNYPSALLVQLQCYFWQVTNQTVLWARHWAGLQSGDYRKEAFSNMYSSRYCPSSYWLPDQDCLWLNTAILQINLNNWRWHIKEQTKTKSILVS